MDNLSNISQKRQDIAFLEGAGYILVIVFFDYIFWESLDYFGVFRAWIMPPITHYLLKYQITNGLEYDVIWLSELTIFSFFLTLISIGILKKSFNFSTPKSSVIRGGEKS